MITIINSPSQLYRNDVYISLIAIDPDLYSITGLYDNDHTLILATSTSQDEARIWCDMMSLKVIEYEKFTKLHDPKFFEMYIPPKI